MKRELDWFPNPAEYPASRLFCLDLLRGLDMFYLAVGGAFLPPLLKWCGASPETIRFVCHHPWYGFSMYDIIMPLFIFMSGAAVPFALGRRLGSDGRPAPGYWKHVWSRVALLWVLGLLAQGQLAQLDIHTFALYSNTLQTIAVGYLAAAILLPVKSIAVKAAVPIALLIVYGLLIHFGGGYDLKTNLAGRIDLTVFGWILPADNKALAYTAKSGYAWLLPSMMFPVLALAGCYATQLLRSGFPVARKVVTLLALGLVSLGLGWLLVFMGVLSVKHIFSVSFTLQALGWCLLLLWGCYVLTDVLKLRKGTGLLLLFGQFALTAYMAESVFRGTIKAFAERLFCGCAKLVPSAGEQFILGVGFGIAVIALLVVRRRLALGEAARRALREQAAASRRGS